MCKHGSMSRKLKAHTKPKHEAKRANWKQERLFYLQVYPQEYTSFIRLYHLTIPKQYHHMRDKCSNFRDSGDTSFKLPHHSLAYTQSLTSFFINTWLTKFSVTPFSIPRKQKQPKGLSANKQIMNYDMYIQQNAIYLQRKPKS